MERMKEKGLIVVGLVVLCLFIGGTLFAQDGKPADTMQIVREKVRADKKLLVAENMELAEAEAKAFWPLYERYQDELFLLRSRAYKLIKDYADAYDTMTNDAAKRLVDEYLTIETLQLKLRKAYLPKFRRALPEIKVMRYYQIENKIQAALAYELGASIPLAQGK